LLCTPAVASELSLLFDIPPISEIIGHAQHQYSAKVLGSIVVCCRATIDPPGKIHARAASLLLVLCGLWLGALLIYRKSIAIKAVCASIAAVALAIAVLPGKPADPTAMRCAYIKSLRFYRGTRISGRKQQACYRLLRTRASGHDRRERTDWRGIWEYGSGAPGAVHVVAQLLGEPAR